MVFAFLDDGIKRKNTFSKQRDLRDIRTVSEFQKNKRQQFIFKVR